MVDLDPLIKWPGGKSRELDVITKYIPSPVSRYFEPFFGGGAVAFAISPPLALVNDIDEQLMAFYDAVKDQDHLFFDELQLIISDWRLIEYLVPVLESRYLDSFPQDLHRLDYFELDHIRQLLAVNKDAIESILVNMNRVNSNVYHQYLVDSIVDKSRRVLRLQQKHETIFSPELMREHLMTAIKSAYYIMIRNEIFNVKSTPAVFFFIREFCYGSMFRFNSKGEFNIPYGGKSYNSKDIETKIKYLKSDEVRATLDNIEFYNLDFLSFLTKFELTTEDFVFLDPPYDSDFKNYGKNPFGPDDQRRLAEFLETCQARWLLVIQKSDLIWELYSQMRDSNSEITILAYDKKYTYNVRGRNDRDVSHLLIKNF